MKYIYLDDSYIKSCKEEKTPRINAIGGIIIDETNEEKLIQIIKNVKEKYIPANLPIKWNFKDTDVERIYKEFKKESEYKKILENSRNIRLEIIKESLSINYKILFSCIQNYSLDKNIIKNKKNDFSQILFENLLYRIGNEAKYSKNKYQIIMDWPTEGNPKPYNRAYYYMYNTNKTITGNNNFNGPLCKLGCKPSIFYTKCTHSPCLQFTDMIIGAIKDYIEMSLDKKRQNDSCVGKEAFQMFKNKIRSYDNRVIGYGIIVPSGNTIFRQQMKSLFED